MNREIKYRAWHKRYKEVYEVTCIDWEAQFVWVKYYDNDREEWFSREEHFTDVELMQYTGLKDKNGVEIYDNYFVDKEYKTINGSIQKNIMRVFQDHTGSWRVKYLNGKTDTVHSVRKELTVIGNVYQSINLLEEPK